MMLIVLVCASDRCGNDINPASSWKVFKRFRKVLKAKKFLDLVRHRLDTYSGSRIHRRLRGVWLTLDYICYLFWKICYKLGIMYSSLKDRCFFKLIVHKTSD